MKFSRGWTLVFVTLLLSVLSYGLARAQTDPRTELPKTPGSQRVATVQLRDLTRSVVTRGTVDAETSVSPNVQGSADGRVPVVTGTPVSQGAVVGVGSVVLEVVGRPVIVLVGTIPMYRDLEPGESGPDVMQLQASLATIGLGSQDPAGYYGLGTAAAVSSLYRQAGYSPPEPSPSAAAELDSAESAVEEARRAALESRKGPLDVLEARVSVSAAERQLVTSVQAAAATEASNLRRLAELQEAIDKAPQEALQELRLAAIDAEVQRDEAGRASREAVAASIEQLALARARLESVTASDEVDSAARMEQSRLADRLAKASLSAASPLPLAEVVFVSTAPATVTSLEATVGEPLGTTSGGVELSTGPIGVKVELEPSAAVDVSVGMSAFVDVSESDRRELSVSSLSSTDSTSDTETKVVGFLTSELALPPELVGGDVRVTIVTSEAEGEVLAVPIEAVRIDAAGEASAVELDDEGRRTVQRIVIGPVVDGWVPILKGDLRVGSRLDVSG